MCCEYLSISKTENLLRILFSLFQRQDLPWIKPFELLWDLWQDLFHPSTFVAASVLSSQTTIDNVG